MRDRRRGGVWVMNALPVVAADSESATECGFFGIGICVTGAPATTSMTDTAEALWWGT